MAKSESDSDQPKEVTFFYRPSFLDDQLNPDNQGDRNVLEDKANEGIDNLIKSNQSTDIDLPKPN